MSSLLAYHLKRLESERAIRAASNCFVLCALPQSCPVLQCRAGSHRISFFFQFEQRERKEQTSQQQATGFIACCSSTLSSVCSHSRLVADSLVVILQSEHSIVLQCTLVRVMRPIAALIASPVASLAARSHRTGLCAMSAYVLPVAPLTPCRTTLCLVVARCSSGDQSRSPLLHCL